MNQFENIKKFSSSEVSECSCNTCQNMCKTCPCLGTPDDIQKLIDAGHIDRLSPVMYAVGFLVFNTGGVIEMMQATTRPDRSCTFLLPSGLCEIHGDLKPTEGKLVNHSSHSCYTDSANYHVAQSWTTEEGKLKLVKFLELKAKSLK